MENSHIHKKSKKRKGKGVPECEDSGNERMDVTGISEIGHVGSSL